MFAALLVALVIWALLAILHWLFAGSRRDAELTSVYECGFSPVADQVRTPIPLHFYLVGVLFLLFDLEVVLVYPYAVTALASTGLSTALYVGFIVLLTLGYAYELACGAIAFAERDNLLVVFFGIFSGTSVKENRSKKKSTQTRSSRLSSVSNRPSA